MMYALSLDGTFILHVHDFQTLAAQIKKAQAIVSEVQEMSRQLILDSAMLSPNVFRKHYLPESAYTDFFTATAQHQRGSSSLPPFSNLFYDSLPSFGDDIPLILEAIHPTTSESSLPDPKSGEHAQYAPSDDVSDLDFVLPKKIPPPKTDSIPRPTWSECIPAKSDPTSDRSGSYTLSRSLDSPVATTGSFELSSSTATQPPKDTSLSGSIVSSKVNAPYSSVFTDAGPDATVSSVDSGMDSMVSSLADKLTSSIHLSDRPPTGGTPTEILRMLGPYEVTAILFCCMYVSTTKCY